MKRTLLALLLVAKSLSAQDFSEQVSVSYVMVPFSVLGAKGVPITDLSAKEVTLLVDGKKVAKYRLTAAELRRILTARAGRAGGPGGAGGQVKTPERS